MPIIIEPKSREEWLGLRTQDVTSTEVPALYGESPYMTEFELYHHKLNKTYSEIDDNDRMKWGRRLQDVIAAGIAEDNGWQVKPLTCYARHSTQRGMGSSFDYEVRFEDGVYGIMECKAVDFLQHRDNWIEDGENSEAPIHIEFQLQHQLEVLDRPRGVIAALVSGNKPIVIKRERDYEMGKKFCERVEEFWQDIEVCNAPPIDYNRDSELLKKLFLNTVPRTEVLTGNNRAEFLCSEYMIAQQIEKTGATRKEAAGNELLTILNDAEKGIVGQYRINAATINRAGFSVEPCQYRNMRITKKKA